MRGWWDLNLGMCWANHYLTPIGLHPIAIFIILDLLLLSRFRLNQTPSIWASVVWFGLGLLFFIVSLSIVSNQIFWYRDCLSSKPNQTKPCASLINMNKLRHWMDACLIRHLILVIEVWHQHYALLSLPQSWRKLV